MIVVFGSINLDICVAAQNLPMKGETVAGRDTVISPGGKGANQAHAARRWGVPVSLFGAVGADGFSDPALAQLIASGVEIGGVVRVPAQSTGIALITVDAQGDNTIVVAAGANALASAAQVPDDALRAAAALLLQQEIPAAENSRLARRARALGCTVILNASPLSETDELDLGAVDIVIVNQIELSQLGGRFGQVERDTAKLASAIAALQNVDVLVTLGEAGALLASRKGDITRTASQAVDVIDSTGAGDTFAGVFAAATTLGETPENAMRSACAAAALACTARGAQIAQPDHAAVERHLASRP